jgi:hypothetical protein
MNDKIIGKWVRSFGSRYWEGPCTCGSGREGHELYDGNGIYCGISCSKCRREDTYRPEIMNRAYDSNDVDEQIEPDDDGGERW